MGISIRIKTYMGGRKTKKDKELYLEFSKEETKNKAKERIHSIIRSKVKVLPKNGDQQALIDSILKNEITICSGIAGSGKSFVTLGTAINLLIDNENFYEKLYLVKSVTPLKGEELGFLKGDLMEKLTPFMWSFELNVSKLISEDKLRDLIGLKIVNYTPLAYMRGATIDNAIIILDEAQNVSIDNARTFLTRIGENCKIICIGDENQIDLKNTKDSSLGILLNIMSNLDDVGVVKMNPDQINCRNPIITHLEGRFSSYYDEKKKTTDDKSGKPPRKQQLNG
jgi:phosphate starvation-inducible PhoH-like protein